MKKRTSIFISDKIASILRKSDTSLSKRLQEVCYRYNIIVKKNSPLHMFEKKEIQLLKRISKGIDFTLVLQFSFTVCDILEREEADYSVLIEKIKYLSSVQVVALIEYLEEKVK